MSTKKDQLISQLRTRYESKYGSSDALNHVITSELSKMSKKNKISLEDLSELETKISTVSQTASQITSPPELTLRKDSSRPTKFKSNEFIQAISKIHSPKAELQHNLSSSSITKNLPYLKSMASEANSNNTLPPIGPHYLNPMELKVMKSFDGTSHNRRFLSDSSIDGLSEFSMSKSPSMSPTKVDNSSFRMAPDHKGQEREKAIRKNIWKKIDEFNLKKAEEEVQKKTEHSKKKQDEWVATLNQQIAEKKEKKIREKHAENLRAQKSIEIDIQQKIEEEEKEIAEKRNKRSLERENHRQALKEKEEIERLRNLKKEREVHQTTEEIEEYQERKKLHEELKLQKKQYLKEVRLADISSQVMKVQDKINKNKEEDVKFTKDTLEKIIKEEQKSEDFLKALKERAMKMKDAELSKEKGYDNLRYYGQIGADEDSSQGLMKFLYADRHNDKVKHEKKVRNQKLLQQSYAKQKTIQVERSQEYKDHIAGQKELWKEEEEQMNAREELMVKINKLKKQMTREGLDAQKEIDSPLKVQIVSPHEVWVNKNTLKEMRVI